MKGIFHKYKKGDMMEKWTFFSEEYPNTDDWKEDDYCPIIVLNSEGYEGKYRWTKDTNANVKNEIARGKIVPLAWRQARRNE